MLTTSIIKNIFKNYEKKTNYKYIKSDFLHKSILCTIFKNDFYIHTFSTVRNINLKNLTIQIYENSI